MAALAGTARADDDATPARIVDDLDDEAALSRARAVGGKLQLLRGPDAKRPEEDPRPRGGWLKATADAAEPSAVESHALTIVVPLPDGLDLSRHAGLELNLRAPAAEGCEPPVVRVTALDADGKTLFTRRLREAAREEWSGVSQPLYLFRWGERVGRWSDVRAVAVVSAGGPSLEVDHLRVTRGERGAASAAPPEGWLASLAWPKRATPRRVQAGQIVLLIDPAVPSDDATALRVAERVRPIAAWLDRVAADAVDPLDELPIEAVVLADRAGMDRFFGRLGGEWRAQVVPSTGQGYTVQDIIGVYDEPGKGIDRPVVFHEFVHAVVARRLRLPAGKGPSDWLQEGLATHLQFALFPGAFNHAQWPVLVERMRPLAEAARDPVFNDYPGLAAVVAFLVSERPPWLASLVRSLRGGATFEAAVKAAPGGATIAALDRDWRHWARRTLCDKKAAPDAPHWPVPAEWKK